MNFRSSINKNIEIIQLHIVFVFSYADLSNYARLKKNKTYICKPDSGCQGRGIFITKNPFKDIKPGDNYVAQVYVSRVNLEILKEFCVELKFYFI